MPLAKNFTPLPPVRFPPQLWTIGDWHDLQGNSTHEILSAEGFQDQALELEHLAGRPESQVQVQTHARYTDARGEQSDTETVQTSAQGDFNFPTDVGQVATSRFEWEAINNSGTSFTAGGSDPYQTYAVWAIRQLTVIEKLRRQLPLTSEEEDLAERRFSNEPMPVTDRVALNIPPKEDPAFQPNLDGKKVIEESTVTDTIDITTTGTSGSKIIADESTRRDPTTGTPSDVIYLTGIGVSAQEHDSGDDIQVRVFRDESNEIARLDWFGIPGIGTGQGVGTSVNGVSFPPYVAPFHVPFLNRMTISVMSQTTDPNNLDVRVEYARVERTLVEKALYGLRNQVRDNDTLADRRIELYETIRDKLRVGLPIELERQQVPAEPGGA